MADALVIASSAYAVAEICAELGNIPPAFMPIGNRRLFEYQCEWAKSHYENIIITLPSGYQVDESDVGFFRLNNVEMVFSDSGLTLAESLLQVISPGKMQGVDVLFGDTFIPSLSPLPDSVALSTSHENYGWHYENEDDAVERRRLWAGYFSFSDVGLLAQCLLSENEFIDVVKSYAKSRPLEKFSVLDWYDFGHVHTYFSSKRKMTTERHFNMLSIEAGVLHKSSHDSVKMEAESSWFESAPECIRVYLPKYIGRERDKYVNGYSLEYLPLFSLSEIYVFGRLPSVMWERIFRSCSDFLGKCQGVPVSEKLTASNIATEIFYQKTKKRTDLYAKECSIDLGRRWVLEGESMPSIHEIIENSWLRIKTTPAVISGFCHGDFCLSNVLYDFRAGRIKVIDPRGRIFDDEIGFASDIRYDIAKMAHSIIGGYDHIVAGKYRLDVDGHDINFQLMMEAVKPVQEGFSRIEICGRKISEWDVEPMLVMLFLSMLPLHKDNPARQMAFLANALRIYKESML
jgi:hypothetical protein